jgi:magnesium transporter
MEVNGFDVTINKLIILVRSNLVVTLHSTNVSRFINMRRYGYSIIKKLSEARSQERRVTLLLIRIVNENDMRNFDHIREMEIESDIFSKELINPNTKRELIGRKIYQMKHALIACLGGLWATIDALNSIRYGDAKMLSDDPQMLNMVIEEIDRVTSMIGLTEKLSDVLSSGIEAVQAVYSNQLQIMNNKLTMIIGWLTLIGTAFYVPNTIASIAANGMFGFTSNDVLPYMALVFGSTVGSVFFMYWLIKQVGLWPKID